MAATLADRKGAVELLLNAGANPSLKDSKQRTALDIAKNDAIKRLFEQSTGSKD